MDVSQASLCVPLFLLGVAFRVPAGCIAESSQSWTVKYSSASMDAEESGSDFRIGAKARLAQASHRESVPPEIDADQDIDPRKSILG